MDSPKPYSLLVLPRFDDDEYLKDPAYDGLEKPTEVADTGNDLELILATGTSVTRGGRPEDDDPLDI